MLLMCFKQRINDICPRQQGPSLLSLYGGSGDESRMVGKHLALVVVQEQVVDERRGRTALDLCTQL